MRSRRWIAVPPRSTRLLALAGLAGSSSLLSPHILPAQALTGKVIVHVTANSAPLVGAAIATGTARTETDRAGLATFNLPLGVRTFLVRSAGFAPETLQVNVGSGVSEVTIALHAQDAGFGVVQAGREARRAATNQPTNVEVADREALDAQIDRSPGTIDGLLARMDGVRVQPLLAGSGGDGIRIRGMPGRYTKILMDGLPVFGATPEGLEPLQTSPLGLDHVEVIPGVTSALSGPTALSGVVNMVSASPASPSDVVLNGTTREASDVAIWQTHTFNPKLSASLLAGRHNRNEADPDADGWAEVAGYKRFNIRPRVYWSQSDQSNWFFTGGWTSENRRSGTFQGARLPDFNRFSDDADTRRADLGTVGRILLDTNTTLTIRASLTREWRTRWFSNNRERDRRNAIFSDATITKTLGTSVLDGGVAFERDQFNALDTQDESYRFTTPAVFADETWTANPWFSVTMGVRLDLHSDFGDFISPRAALMFRPSETLTARLSASSGVYAPTPLTDDTDGFGIDHLRPTDRQAEHATGWSLDLEKVNGGFDLRGSAFRTVVNHPLVLRASASGQELQLINSDDPAHYQGIDVSARYRVRPIVFMASYSYLDSDRPQIAQIVGADFSFDTTMHRAVPLNPRHSARAEMAYDDEHDVLLGVGAAFTGRQTLSDTLATVTQPYITLDARFEKHIRAATFFVYGLNLTGVHQRQYAPVLLAASGNAGQWSGDAWAPLEGRVINAGLRFRY